MKAVETVLGYLTPFIINAYSAWKERSSLCSTKLPMYPMGNFSPFQGGGWLNMVKL